MGAEYIPLWELGSGILWELENLWSDFDLEETTGPKFYFISPLAFDLTVK